MIKRFYLLQQFLLASVLTLSSSVASAAIPHLVFLEFSNHNNAEGNFAGIPGGTPLSNYPRCQTLHERIQGETRSAISFIATRSPERRYATTKDQIRNLFVKSPFLQEIILRVRDARKLSHPEMSDIDASAIYFVIHDCTFDGLGTGPAVTVLKNENSPGIRFEGNVVPWVMLLSNANWGKLSEMFNAHSSNAHVPEEVIGHELTHGITADLLSGESIQLSNAQKTRTAHDAPLISDVSTAFWEGFAEGVEASYGDDNPTVTGYPFSINSGAYGFLVERQIPVRNNHFVNLIEPYGKIYPRSPGDLMKSEGFIATLMWHVMKRAPYTMPDGQKIQGWPFSALAKTIYETQPTNTFELLDGIFRTPNGGHEALEAFLNLSYFITVDPLAYELRAVILKTQQEIAQLTAYAKLHFEDVRSTQALRKAEETLILAQQSWDEKFAPLWKNEVLNATRSAFGAAIQELFQKAKKEKPKSST